MKYNLKRITSRAFVIYVAINIFTYLFAHVAYLFANDVIGVTFEYISYYLSKTVEFIAPPVLASVALLVLFKHGKGKCAKFTLALASARLFYSLPYYYIIFIYNYGYDSIESICLSLLASALVILVTALGTLVCIAVYYCVLKLKNRREGLDLNEAQEAVLKSHPTADFLSLTNLPVLVFALLRFFFSFAVELFDTVSFFIAYRSDYQPIEIITILVNFTLLFVLLTVSYLIAAKIKNVLVSDSQYEPESNTF